jgi:hypothetical protein
MPTPCSAKNRKRAARELPLLRPAKLAASEMRFFGADLVSGLCSTSGDIMPSVIHYLFDLLVDNDEFIAPRSKSSLNVAPG